MSDQETQLMSPAVDLENRRAAVRRIRERREGVTLEGLRIKDLINAGRENLADPARTEDR